MERKRVLFSHSDNPNYMHENAAKSKLGIVALSMCVMGERFFRLSEEQRGGEISSALTAYSICDELLSPSSPESTP